LIELRRNDHTNYRLMKAGLQSQSHSQGQWSSKLRPRQRTEWSSRGQGRGHNFLTIFEHSIPGNHIIYWLECTRQPVWSNIVQTSNKQRIAPAAHAFWVKKSPENASSGGKYRLLSVHKYAFRTAESSWLGAYCKCKKNYSTENALCVWRRLKWTWWQKTQVDRSQQRSHAFLNVF